MVNIRRKKDGKRNNLYRGTEMKKIFCIIGMILFAIPAVVGYMLAAPFLILEVLYEDEV